MSGTAQEAGAEASRSDVGFGFRCFEGRVYVDSLLTTAHKTPYVPTCTPNPTKPQALKPTTPDWLVWLLWQLGFWTLGRHSKRAD